MPARTDRDAREGNHEPIETSAAAAADDTLPSRRTAPGPRGATRTLSPLLATTPRLTRHTLLPLLPPVSQDGRAPPGRGVQGEDASRVQDGRDDEGPRADGFESETDGFTDPSDFINVEIKSKQQLEKERKEQEAFYEAEEIDDSGDD